MQIISHKNTSLSICQKYFIEKSLELLYANTVDSYRVRINNPKTILLELKYCLEEFECGRIKHFTTIKAPKDKYAIVDEALNLIKRKPNYLEFNSISSNYLELQLTQLSENNYKKVISTLDIILSENTNYLSKVIDEIEQFITTCTDTFDELVVLDTALNILYSELISIGFSKSFLYKLIYGIFVNTLTNSVTFDDNFTNFKKRILTQGANHKVVFKIDSTTRVFDALSKIATATGSIQISDNIDDIKLSWTNVKKEFGGFRTTTPTVKYIKCQVIANDYYTALKNAKSILSEYLDIINLGLSDDKLHIHNRILVIDLRSPERGQFQNDFINLDGKYETEQEHYKLFAQKLPLILSSLKISHETKEKIKSAIRYLRLGNESVEMEHKFINYWIGLEYLFSNYESSSTINRLKEHFINAHTIAYTKRNLYSFKKSFNQLNAVSKSKVPTFSTINDDFLKSEDFYKEIFNNLLVEHPLLAYRAAKIKNWFFETGKPANGKKYINKHKNNLEIHFTRIYRLRNEIIHDAATNTNNQQIASNLKYYLIFILNELIDFLSKNSNKEVSIEDYFILNEIRLGNIEQNGSLLIDLLEVDNPIDFIT